MTTNDTLVSLARDIGRAAKFVAFQWPGVIGAEDAEQMIYIRLLGSPGYTEKISKQEPAARYRAICWIANQIASKERHKHYMRNAAYRYSLDEVRHLLKSGALHDDELDLPAQTFDGEDTSSGTKEPTTLIPVQVSDLRAALARVAEGNRSYAAALISRYRLDQFPGDKSEEHALRRGTEALVNEMNRVRRVDHSERDDGPGTRQPIRREAARFASKDAWDADYTPVPAHLRDNRREKEVWG